MSRVAAGVVTLGVFGTALLYGDGLITPAISVLSAVEGFEVATPALDVVVIPIAVVILVGLFVIQRRGTGGIAKVFGPVMVVWFVVLGILGLHQIRQAPGVMRAVSPTYAFELFVQTPVEGVPRPRFDLPGRDRRRGAVRRHGPLRPPPDPWAWYVLVLPCLVLNYFGQAALLSGRPTDDIGDARSSTWRPTGRSRRWRSSPRWRP